MLYRRLNPEKTGLSFKRFAMAFADTIIGWILF
jgi:hypothetical protein